MSAAQPAKWAKIQVTSATDSGLEEKEKRKLSAARRRKLIKALAKARKIRSAKLKAAKLGKSTPAKKDKRSSPTTRAKLSAAAKARWKKARAEGKTKL